MPIQPNCAAKKPSEISRKKTPLVITTCCREEQAASRASTSDRLWRGQRPAMMQAAQVRQSDPALTRKCLKRAGMIGRSSRFFGIRRDTNLTCAGGQVSRSKGVVLPVPCLETAGRGHVERGEAVKQAVRRLFPDMGRAGPRLLTARLARLRRSD